MIFSVALILCVSAAQAPSAPTRNPTVERAAALLKEDRPRDAIEVCSQLLELRPEDPQAWLLLGRASRRIGDLPTALRADSKAAAFPEVAGRANFELACVWAKSGDQEKAFQALERAHAAGFDDWFAMQMDFALNDLRGDPRFAPLLPPPPDWSQAFLEPGVSILHSWSGEHPSDQFGWLTVDVGDVDGDGVHDALISAPFVRDLGDGRKSAVPAGRVYLYSGKSGAEITHHDGKSGDLYGMCICGTGDLDGDGRADYAIGAPQALSGTGRVEVWSGGKGKLLHEFQGEARGDQFGRELCGPGDLDGDGVPELMIAAPGKDGPAGRGAGRVTIYSGSSWKDLRVYDGVTAGENFGSALAGRAAGERTRLVIGAMDGGSHRRGRIAVFGPTLHLIWAYGGDQGNFDLGRFFVAVPGDLDGDGIPEIYASDFAASSGGSGSGEYVLLSGKDGKPLRRRSGRPQEGLGLGEALAGDVDGDGVMDLIVGAWTATDGGPESGRVYLRSGRDGRLLRTFTSAFPGESLGFDATGIGDVNGDGHPDFLISAAWSRINGYRSGRVFLVSGAGAAAAAIPSAPLPADSAPKR